jgi:hypothetical protein
MPRIFLIEVLANCLERLRINLERKKEQLARELCNKD